MDETRPAGGAFTEYEAMTSDLTVRIQEDMSFEDAYTVELLSTLQR